MTRSYDRADNKQMAHSRSSEKRRIEVECLACGAVRAVAGLTRDELDVCDRCGYVGWALTGELDDRDRRGLHAVPLASRATFRPAGRI